MAEVAHQPRGFPSWTREDPPQGCAPPTIPEKDLPWDKMPLPWHCQGHHAEGALDGIIAHIRGVYDTLEKV